MRNVKKIVKDVLKEAAGISFEVREWAKIIETHVDDVIKQEREKLNAKKADTTQPKSQDDEVFDGEWNEWEGMGTESPGEDVDEWNAGFTHFAFDDRPEETTDVALIYGDELWINGDILDEMPSIKNEVQGKLFKITMVGDGDFDVEPTAGSTITSYDFIPYIEEMIEDHMLKGEPFYTDDYDLVYAVASEDPNDYVMYSENAGEWSGNWTGGWGNWFQKQPKVELVEIDGKDYPEAYEKFQVDKWIITNSGRIEYDHWRSGYDDDGNYVVYLNMPMGSIGGTMLVHEVKHAYDDWNRMSKGKPAIRDGWEIQNIYTKDFEKLVLGAGAKYNMIGPIVRYYYLGSKLESPAYLENEYDSAYGTYRDTAKKLMNFKASNYLNKQGGPAKGLQEMWADMLINYNIPFFRKFPDVVEFLKYTEKYFNRRGRDILRRIDKMRYVHDKPMAKPVVRTFPSTTRQTPATTKPTAKPIGGTGTKEISDIYDEIDKIEKEISDYVEKGEQANKKMIGGLEGYLDYLYDKVDKLTGGENTNDDLPY